VSTQPPTTADDHTVDLGRLRTCLEQALIHLEVPQDHAVQIADVLLDAELRGYDDHGVFFLGDLAGWYRAGALNPAPEIRVVHESDSALLLDGDRGCAVAASYRAMAWCVERAKSRGMASAGIRNSGHFIAAAPYPTAAAREGCIALAAANVTPLMPPPGGRTRTLGTNPLCFAAPTGGRHPLVFDMATSAIAGFKVRMAARQGRTLDEGLITDALGRPTTEPSDFEAGGLLLPVGGHKGFGLALMVEILAGVLTGARFGKDAGITHGKEGHLFLALDPALFMPLDEFTRRMDELIRHVKSGDRLEGVEEIVVPGERGQRRAAELTRSGRVPLNPIAWSTLADVCSPLGVPLPA
jgi:LDH2 family malate/lactate/ureidoglycolate dehydrogenase